MSIFLIKTLQLLGALSILVFIHELGHFTFAKIFKMRVEKFYLFFDWSFSLFKFKPKGSETEYGIGWLPLGGYCKIAGMVDESMDTKNMESEPQPWEFRAKPAWQRLLVMSGGVLFNIILACVIYAGLAFFVGEEKIPMENVGENIVYSEIGHKMGLEDGDRIIDIDNHPVKYFDSSIVQEMADAKQITVLRNGQRLTIEMPIDFMQALIASRQALFKLRLPAFIEKVVSGSQAAKAGLQKGDEFLSAAGQKVSLMSLVESINTHKGDTISFGIKRGVEELKIIAKVDSIKGLGVQFMPPNKVFKAEQKQYGLLAAVPKGASMMKQTLVSYTKSLKYLFTKEGAQQIGGLGTIGSLFPKEFDALRFWNLTAFLSIILAVMNILPIPALDGGHILFLLVEVVTGKRLPLKFMEWAQIIGIIILFALMIYANINDIFKFLF